MNDHENTSAQSFSNFLSTSFVSVLKNLSYWRLVYTLKEIKSLVRSRGLAKGIGLKLTT